ncbi:ABC transporter [Alteribacter lacisalsi]|uniref:ABC transporter n=1 Tax=Alteribacter lacisalsi TaxID=2045244 RepID=A0A2W0H7J5_9BACI|nr:ABC transporter permease [Alteribacter lacisalsi]PYZ96706.1 ABC transporter [Alteribacter lacisalsi]
MVLRSSYFILRRMMREYVSLSILLLTPLALITVLGLIADDAVNEATGLLYKAHVSVTLILAFQLFGGFYTMEFIRNDLFTAKRWRMHALPYHVSSHAFSIVLTSTIFSILQGLVLMMYTYFVYGVDWGNPFFALGGLAAVAVFSQLVFLNLVLGVKNYKTAERAGTTFGFLSIILAETWFSLPDQRFFTFLSTYGNPLSLGETIMHAGMHGENIQQAFISLAILIGMAAILIVLAWNTGRRRIG